MDKNTIIGIVLIIGILVGYSIWNRPSKEELERMQHRRDSIAVLNRAAQERLAEEHRKAEQESILFAPDTTTADTVRKQQMKELFGAFAGAAQGENRFITMENDLMKVTFSTKGGRPYSVELKNYKRYDQTPLILFNGDSTVFGFNFFSNNRSISTHRLFFEPSDSRSEIRLSDDSVTLKMRLKSENDAYIEYCYTMKAGEYMMKFDVNMVNMNKLIASNQTMIDFQWQAYSPRQEKGAENENTYTALFYKAGDNVKELGATKEMETRKESYLNWISFKQQFFSWALIFHGQSVAAEMKSQKPASQHRYIKQYEAAVGIELNSRQTTQTIPMSLYFGPNHYNTLKRYDLGLEQMVPLGKSIIRWINRFIIIPLFDWLGSFIGNYGLIILLMTIIIKAGLLPLTFKSFMSSAKMRVLKPQIDEINHRIPKEKAMERQQAVMALYRKAGVSPMGGCLPMLLQMPILLAMFRFFPSSIELRQQSFLWAEDLSTYDSILNLPFTIPFYGDHISLFTILMTVATVFSMRMSSGQTDTSAMPGMKTMMYIMPVMFMFFLNNYSAGLTYYYFIANVITITQNEIFKRGIDEKKLLQKLHANSAKPVKKSRFQQRLDELQKQQRAQARANAKKRK
ncbi:MAG: membrane protein insertase YidC [Bacteroidales bacterium]|jgi:YidC/Oxa1 family membrane protein insertase|nr:membrane protein insertase YidC [Bacteroidales bacterium]